MNDAERIKDYVQRSLSDVDFEKVIAICQKTAAASSKIDNVKSLINCGTRYPRMKWQS